jgi:site-specific recombinase XerD
VKASEWLGDRVVNRPDADELNNILYKMNGRAYEEVQACMDEGRSISMTEIKKRIWEVNEDASDKPTFLVWVNEQIPMLRLCEGTMKHYRTVEDRLKMFGRFRKWSDLTTENVYMWDAFLHGIRRNVSDADKKAGKKGELISEATIHVHHKCLKALINRAEKFGLVSSNPYNRLRGEFGRGEKENVEYLTEEEMEAFMSLHPLAGTQMAVARDLFVFQMFTGLPYSGMQTFDISHYKKEKVGVSDATGTVVEEERWVHTGNRIKTGTAYVSQLLPPAVEVLEKYGMQIPKIENSDYNHALKALGYAAGIPTPLHSHLARHTFATYMLRNGVKIENLSKMLGHTNIIQTQRYAKVLAQSVHEEYEKIGQKLKNKKK